MRSAPGHHTDELAILTAAHRVQILPDDVAFRCHLEQPPAFGFRDQRIAVREALLLRAHAAVERPVAVPGVLPDDPLRVGIELDHARDAALAIVPVVVEQKQVAVGQQVGIVLADPGPAQRPAEALVCEIEDADRAQLPHRQQDRLPGAGRQSGDGGRVEQVDRVGMEVIALGIPRDLVDHARERRVDEGIDHRHLLQLLAVRRQHHDEIIDPRRRQMPPEADCRGPDLLGQDVDPTVAADVQIVMSVLQILPDHLRILVHLDQAITPGGIARGLVNRQQIAIGIQMGLAKVDQGIGLRNADRGGLVPDFAERQLPFVHDLAGHRDQDRPLTAAGGVQGEAVGGALRVVYRDAARLAPHRLPELGRIGLPPFAPLVEQGMPAPIGVGQLARRERVDEDQVAAGNQAQEGDRKHDCDVGDKLGD